MSNALAIASVTSTLRYLLLSEIEPDVSGVAVTTKSPDKVRSNNQQEKNQINIFLYRTAANAAYRNSDIPTQTRNGETGQPPLALNLYYLISAYCQDEDDLVNHHLLARAMSILYDHAVLFPDDIKSALSASDLPLHDLYNQIEKVRITPSSLSLDEMSKLWTTFQTNYRISAYYEASVVLIDSTRPTKAPLPVLTYRFKDGGVDKGLLVQPDLMPPYPILTAAIPPNQQVSIQLGENLTLNGFRLDTDNPSFNLSNRYLREPAPTTLISRTATQIIIKLTDDPNKWVAGFYTVAVTFRPAGETTPIKDRTTNEISFSLAPQIKTIAALRDGSGDVTIQVTCNPKLRSGQRATLFLSDRGDGATILPISNQEIIAKPLSVQIEGAPIVQTNTLEFEVGNIPAGDYFVRSRLRIDGVDSLLLKNYVSVPPVFIDFQKLTIP
ncbi:hypothetical protein A6770_22080 [Nostoc minutum NIES-26]|uniref:Pvc16 N-terminal domain-containing protein n=1 Tax=Nostoc minutum NIES-26 TaxID=1844469 RepID=A0A367R1U4_9NOSO|nr:hypothetical protein A6770_22080 [Nostoc minutum NIES-26]